MGATAYRMLFGWPPHNVQEGDVVLVWGASGRLMALQLAANAGAKPIGVVSSPAKFEHCMRLGAIGCINRKDFSHWGRLPDWTDNDAMGSH